MINKLLYCFFTVFLFMQSLAAEPLDMEAVKQAAEQGDMLAQSQLASSYYLGQQPSGGRTEAASLFRKSATQGDLDSMVMLGVMSDLGSGMTQSLSIGTSWYQKAADLGHGPSKGVLSYYNDTERATKALSIGAQYAKKILKKRK